MIRKLKLPGWSWMVFFSGLVFCFIVIIGGNKAMNFTSTDRYCQSCHIHTHAEDTWKKSTHFYNKSGVRVHCVECHLPPGEEKGYLLAKARTGLKDLYGFYFKDSASFDWENKRVLGNAIKIVYNSACVKCHQTLFSKGLSAEGSTAHLYYEINAGKLNIQCINCHLDAGHFNPHYMHGQMKGIPLTNSTNHELYTQPTRVTAFEDYTEHIPNTTVSFRMVTVQGGKFKMGSPDNESFRNSDEGPVRDVSISSFFMGETEVSWDEYWAFFAATMSEGRINPVVVMAHNASDPDAFTGPTPPFGIPDQGWGGGKRPVITVTHYAASIYCQWLSKVTGKKYRLPTEAEWEYACRAGTETPYFFEGNPRRMSETGFFNRIFGADTAHINTYAVYALNSTGRTQEPEFVKANPFGLKNMLGNVMEYCSDWYAENAYAQTSLDVTDPKGPDTGTEHVVRGGYYISDARDLRCASRSKTRSKEWLKTDPQNPKSIWWYTDINGIGFRVVCEREVP